MGIYDMNRDMEIAVLYEKIRTLEAKLESADYEIKDMEDEIKLLRAVIRKWVGLEG